VTALRSYCTPGVKPSALTRCPSEFCLGDGCFRGVVVPPPGMLGRRLVLHHRLCRFAERQRCQRCLSHKWRVRCRRAFRLSWPPTHSLAPNVRHTLLPGLRPPVRTHRISQRQHRIDAQSAPMHARALQPRLDYHFAGADLPTPLASAGGVSATASVSRSLTWQALPHATIERTECRWIRLMRFTRLAALRFSFADRRGPQLVTAACAIVPICLVRFSAFIRLDTQ